MKVKLRNILNLLAMTDGQISTAISQMTGQPFPSDLVSRAADGQPVTAIHANQICVFLSKQLGQEIQPAQISDLRTHPLSTLPDDAAKTEEGQKAILAYLESQGYRITPPALLAEQFYQEGDYLHGDLHPRNWKALANRRVPWPKDMDPNVALHELAPFMTHRLLVAEAASMGRSIDAFVQPDEQV